MIDKTFPTAAEALADVRDGATVMVGGQRYSASKSIRLQA